MIAALKIRTSGQSSGVHLGRLFPLTQALSPVSGERGTRGPLHPHKRRKSRFSLGGATGLIMAVLLMSGCGLLYTNVHVPRAYRSATPVDVPSKPSDKLVTGEACNHSVLFLVAWGNAGYATAVSSALDGEAAGSILYDVQSDLKATVYLFGLYTRSCTIVTGKVASP